MTIFTPQNVIGPAHRGATIQQLAQTAAQNVMRRQKLRSLLSQTAGAIGGGQPFRNSTMGRPTAVRGATFRPAMNMGGQQSAAYAPAPAMMSPAPQWAEAGSPDLPSLPDQSDPRQSPSSTEPGPNSATGSTFAGSAPSNAIRPGLQIETPGSHDDGSGDVSPSGLIPLGGGMFYNPATDSIHGAPTGGGIRPGLQM